MQVNSFSFSFVLQKREGSRVNFFGLNFFFIVEWLGGGGD